MTQKFCLCLRPQTSPGEENRTLLKQDEEWEATKVHSEKKRTKTPNFTIFNKKIYSSPARKFCAKDLCVHKARLARNLAVLFYLKRAKYD